MPVKPFLMSELRRTMPPSPADKHRSSVGIGKYNRFSMLAPDRGRTLSTGKRLLSDDDVIPASPKIPRFDSNQVFEKLASQDKYLDEAKVALKAATDTFAWLYKPDDGGLGTILFNLGSAVEKLVLHSEATKSNLIDLCKVAEIPTKPARVATLQGKPVRRQLLSTSSLAGNRQPAAPKPPPSAEDTVAAKVKRVLREAERRTVVFDLNLGAAPTINKESISKKVTVALHDAVASGKHDWNIKDAGEMVDDVLSCSQLEFLGSGTRKFYNNSKDKDGKEDARNGKMCTVPVRLDLKNKDTRIQAEQTLRSICKVNCSTPYPKKLRALLGKTILKGKKFFPKCYIRTKVDIDNLLVSASVRAGDKWTLVSGPFPIPLDILDPSIVIPPPEKPESMEIPIPTDTVSSGAPVS